jgi:FtsZ-binding cell division protein ZapB
LHEATCDWTKLQYTPSPWKEEYETLLDELAELADADVKNKAAKVGSEALKKLRALNVQNASVSQRWNTWQTSCKLLLGQVKKLRHSRKVKTF